MVRIAGAVFPEVTDGPQPPPLPWPLRVGAERAVLMVSAAILTAGAAWCMAVAWGLVHYGCPWKSCTGLPCASCGGTRAVVLLFSGHGWEALRMNPGVVAALVAGGVLNLYAAVVLFFRIEPWRPGPVVGAWLRGAVVAAVAANWIYLLSAARV